MRPTLAELRKWRAARKRRAVRSGAAEKSMPSVAVALLIVVGFALGAAAWVHLCR